MGLGESKTKTLEHNENTKRPPLPVPHSIMPTEEERILYCSKYGTFYTATSPGYEKNNHCQKCKKTNLTCYMKGSDCVLCLFCVEHQNSSPLYPIVQIETVKQSNFSQPIEGLSPSYAYDEEKIDLTTFVNDNGLDKYVIQIDDGKPSYKMMCDIH